MQPVKTPAIFLSAKWEYLIMLNYAVPDEILLPYLPKGTELDKHNGSAWISVVGFLFNHTKVFGIKWPWHSHFEEVNLRFYIKYFDGKEWKRGVTFISEIVPKPIISCTANLLYNEHYRYMPMKHQLKFDKEITVCYAWKNTLWNSLSIQANNTPYLIKEGSDEAFIYEHYWGYNQLNKHTIIEYGVEHEKWQVYPVIEYDLSCDVAGIYGPAFVPYIKSKADSAFIAKGSDVTVRKPVYIKV